MKRLPPIAFVAWAVVFGCGAPPGARDAGGYDAPDGFVTPDANIDVAAPSCVLSSDDGATPVEAGCRYTLEGTGEVLEIWTSDGSITVGGEEARHHDPRVYSERLAVVLDASVVHVRNHGLPAESIDIERSLVWVDDALLDDSDHVGLTQVLRAASADDAANALLVRWFERFGTTAHSERLGPQGLVDKIREEQGHEVSAWDLRQAPFLVTGVHNRIDLQDGTHCGEFRVSLASTDPILQPFHIIALFEQPAAPEDLRPDGSAHCVHTALRWARLSALSDAEFQMRAAEYLAEALVHERFIAMESLDFLISPWEWRQWFPSDDGLDNAPLFQTVDTPSLNRPGELRDDFLSFVAANAGPLDERRMLIPERFRSPSARVNDGVPWIPLDLSPLDEGPLEEFPQLRQNIEIVGCPSCHVADAPFVHTDVDRTFSPFYEKELEARRERLRAMQNGAAGEAPFGPLQREAVLTP